MWYSFLQSDGFASERRKLKIRPETANFGAGNRLATATCRNDCPLLYLPCFEGSSAENVLQAYYEYCKRITLVVLGADNPPILTATGMYYRGITSITCVLHTDMF